MLKHGIAKVYRSLPLFRGKARLGLMIQRLLFSMTGPDNLVSMTMLDGSIMNLDLRSRTERFSYWTGMYDIESISFIKEHLRAGSVFLDVGANIGFISIAIGRHLEKLNGKVFAFEPVLANYSRLVSSVDANNLSQTVSAMNVALGAEEGLVAMIVERDNNASTGNACVDANALNSSSTQTRVCALDAIFKDKNISNCDVLKVDIEGYELFFLQGASNFLKQFKPLIFIEFNHPHMRRLGYSYVDILKMTHALGYAAYRFVKTTCTPLEKTLDANGIDNVVLMYEQKNDENPLVRHDSTPA